MKIARRITMLAAIAVVALAVVASSGFAGGRPKVSFTSPSNGATTGSKVTFKIHRSNFKIDAKDVGKTNKAGQGHVHFSMDGGKFDYPKYSGANGKIAVQLGVQGKYSPALGDSITYKGLPKGAHRLVVHLVNNNHSNIGGADDTLRFRVK